MRVAYSVSLSSPNMLCLVTSRSYFSGESSLSMMTESWPSYWYSTKTSRTPQSHRAPLLVLFSHVPVTINERSATHLYMTVEVAGAFFDLSYVAIHP